MADLTITAANVKVKGSTTTVQLVQVGETVTQGQSGYLKSSDSKYWKADADLSAEAAAATGIFMTPAATDGYALIATGGPIDIGATLTQGEIYVVSGTAGGVCPEADLSSAERVTIVGVAADASTLNLNFLATGIAIP